MSDSDCSSCEEDVDSGIVDEPAQQRRDVDCMDLSEFFSYCFVICEKAKTFPASLLQFQGVGGFPCSSL
ncbi:unnamed protein product [Leptosia nina]|uniref:Uncharacterized protein n=1 Tax=Leptosia nina TaxID=320188 RepID=A0AAV1JP48_9NEOP